VAEVVGSLVVSVTLMTVYFVKPTLLAVAASLLLPSGNVHEAPLVVASNCSASSSSPVTLPRRCFHYQLQN